MALTFEQWLQTPEALALQGGEDTSLEDARDIGYDQYIGNLLPTMQSTDPLAIDYFTNKGITQDVINQSPTAQQDGIRTLDDAIRAYQSGNLRDFGLADEGNFVDRFMEKYGEKMTLAFLAMAGGTVGAGMAGFGAGAGAGATAGSDLGWAANLTDAAGGSLSSGTAGSAYAGLGEAAAGASTGGVWESLGNLTDTQQWAQNLGGLNPDGTINWAAIDQSPVIQELGAISGDYGAIPFGTSASGAGTFLDQIQTVLNGGKLPAGSMLQSVQSLFGGNGSGGQSGSGSSPFSNLISGGLGYYGTKQYQDQLLDLMRQTSEQADPFRSQRPQYQQMLSQSYNDPNFFNNNPVFKGLRDLATNDTNRAMAAQGYNLSGNQIMELGQRLQQTGMQYALPFQQQLAQNAGANVNPASGAFLASQLGASAAQAGNNALGNLGYALQPITNSIFGNQSGQQPTNSSGQTPNIMNSLTNLFSLK